MIVLARPDRAPHAKGPAGHLCLADQDGTCCCPCRPFGDPRCRWAGAGRASRGDVMNALSAFLFFILFLHLRDLPLRWRVLVQLRRVFFGRNRVFLGRRLLTFLFYFLVSIG